MTFFDDNFSNPPDQSSSPQPSPSNPSEPSAAEAIAPPLAGDPLSFAAAPRPLPYSQRPEVPEDLRISWSWVHLLCFVLFAFVVLTVVPSLFAIPYIQGKHLRPEKLQNYLYSIPQFVVGSTFAVFAFVLLFLYVTLSVLPAKSFWYTLGWRKLIPTASSLPFKLPANPWLYLFSGAALSLLTSIAGSRVHTPDDMPIELLMKSRVGAMFMMGMAVAVAPLVEETVFRGYLYPVFVRIVSSILRFFGVESGRAIHAGIVGSIVVTGVSFGLLHGAQLAWTWGIVSLLILVGITFTYVRARTGTVFASFLMHLGYNSLIAFVSFAGTHGFTKMSPHP
jgi:membrane protease YdiL (CAAX protease family)